jgi:hypothetical protein
MAVLVLSDLEERVLCDGAQRDQTALFPKLSCKKIVELACKQTITFKVGGRLL